MQAANFSQSSRQSSYNNNTFQYNPRSTHDLKMDGSAGGDDHESDDNSCSGGEEPGLTLNSHEINLLSKKALKRLKRREHFALAKKVKKQRKKEDRQMKIASGEIQLPKPSDPSLIPPTEVIQQRREERKQAKIEDYLASCRKNFDVIIDCAWEKDHTESTLASLTQQIMFCYGLNKRYNKPCLLHLSNLGPATMHNLSKVKFENWIGVTYGSEDYLKLSDRYSIEPCEGKKQLVYLTSDAEEVLETLDPMHAYIIGGIVDRNRLKGATYNKAIGQGIRTAKLPIKEFFSLSATHVLTINHVYEILLKYSVVMNWPEVLAAILPKRKDPTKKNDNKDNIGEDVEDKDS